MRRVKQSGAVAHAARDDVIDREAAPALAGERTARGAGARWLEPEEPAAGGRNADRSATVAGMRRRHDARRHGRGGPAGRAAGRAAQIPRIAGGAAEAALGRWRKGHFRRRRLAEDHQAGALVALYERRVASRHEVGEETGAVCGDRSGQHGADVLEQEGNARERAVRQRTAQALQAVVVELQRKRVDRRIDGFGRSDGGFEQLGRRDGALPHQSGEAESVMGAVVGERDHRNPPGA